MTRDELIAQVGPERYRAACQAARADAARPDYGRDLGRSGGTAPDLPHEIEELIWEAPVPWADRLRLFFTVYDDMPGYAHLMYAKQRYPEFGAPEKVQWWAGVARRVADRDLALRQPLQYALWVDFFEDPRTVEEAWAALAGPEVSSGILRAILPASGPVPYELKARVYERLLPDPGWHEAIFESLLHSAYDVYGQIDKQAARGVLARLRLPAEHAHVADLRGKLA